MTHCDFFIFIFFHKQFCFNLIYKIYNVINYYFMIIFEKQRKKMRQKINNDMKKKSITFTINPEIEKLLNKQIEKLNISRSKFIESLLKEKLTKNNDIDNDC